MIDVSIIIVNWNTRDILRDCLRSVYEQTKDVSFEVIVVDNASTDGSGAMVKRQFPSVVLMENNENMGFAEANNQAIKVAGGRYVLLLNSDTLVLDNAIAKTVKFADEHPDAAVAGCMVLNSDETIQQTCFMYPSNFNMFLAATYLYKIFPKSVIFGREGMTWWDYNDVREVDVVAGCFMLVRREAIQQVGMLDNRYFVYCEETDWCYRFSKKGWKILFTPNARIIHYGGQTANQKARTCRLQLEGSKLIFMKLHRGKLEFPIACFLTALFFLIRVPYWLAIGLFRGKKGVKAIEQATTYLMGTYYCLTNWKKLLMNIKSIKGGL
jgi:GT2 family glycosyltransferase